MTHTSEGGTTKFPTKFPTNYPIGSGASCHLGDNGDNSYCSAACKCDADEGDCDNDDHCAPGTYCATNVGVDYICSDGNPCPAGRDFCQSTEAPSPYPTNV